MLDDFRNAEFNMAENAAKKNTERTISPTTITEKRGKNVV